MTNKQIQDLIAELLDTPDFQKSAWRETPGPFHINLERKTDTADADCHYLADNYQQVVATMSHLMRLPTIEAGAVMPGCLPY